MTAKIPAKRQTRKQKAQESAEVVTLHKVSTDELIRPKSEKQKQYFNSIKNNMITFAYGTAGTGKSLIALYNAIIAYNKGEINKIYYVRANVGMGQEKDIGYLPGSKEAKLSVLAYPIYDNLCAFMNEQKADYVMKTGLIEVLPVSFLRGRSFKDCYVIFDECQNYTLSTFKTCLTRIGDNTKFIFMGDQKQADLRYENGLLECIRRLSDLGDVGIVEFTKEDVIRHPIIPEILDRFDD